MSFCDKGIRRLVGGPPWRSVVTKDPRCSPPEESYSRHPAIMVGMGSFQGGEVWVQEHGQSEELGCYREGSGSCVIKTELPSEAQKGRRWTLKDQRVEIPSQAWYGIEPWEGNMLLTLTAKVCQGYQGFSEHNVHMLRNGSFPIPPQPRERAFDVYALDTRRSGGSRDPGSRRRRG